MIIEATIGRDGTVIETKVLRSVPLLDQAALDAVKQWRFTPTLLNGVPVPVVMTVTVNFTLELDVDLGPQDSGPAGPILDLTALTLRPRGSYSGGIGGRLRLCSDVRRSRSIRCATSAEHGAGAVREVLLERVVGEAHLLLVRLAHPEPGASAPSR